MLHMGHSLTGDIRIGCIKTGLASSCACNSYNGRAEVGERASADSRHDCTAYEAYEVWTVAAMV